MLESTHQSISMNNLVKPTSKNCSLSKNYYMENTVVATNRKAFHEYHILETF